MEQQDIHWVFENTYPGKILSACKNTKPVFTQIISHAIKNNLESLSFSEQAYLCKHNLCSQPVCKCGKPVKYLTIVKGYNRFCSSSCIHARKNAQTMSGITKLQRYGNPTYSAPEKRKNWFSKKTHTEQESINKKRESTNVKKYGVSTPLASKMHREKGTETIVERYGVTHHMKSADVKNSRKSLHIKKYGVSNPFQRDEIKDLIKQNCYNKHGVIHHNQIHIDSASLSYMHNPGWLEFQHETKSVSCISKELGVSQSHLNSLFHIYGIDIRKHYISSVEVEICNYLKSVGIEFRQSARDIISKELDIYIPEYNLAIEVNGVFWHSELNGKDKNYHLSKTKECNALGIHLLHIWDSQWLNNRAIVESKILSLTNKSSKIYARKCTIKPVNATDERDFLNTTHIQGYTPSSLCIGLFYHNQLVAVMSFSRSRYDKLETTELLRYSSSLNTSVIGGASRLLAHFLKNTKVKTIISYSDISWNTGNMYNALGFELVSESGPAYFYTKDYKTLENRIKYQKHKLNNLLSAFDKNLSEWENMKNNGYDRVWNCGNKKYRLKNEI